MLSRLFGLDNQAPIENSTPNAYQSLPAATPFGSLENVLGMLGAGLLAKGTNPDATDIWSTVVPAAQKQAEAERSRILQARIANDFQNSPVLKDPQMKTLVADLVGAGMVDKAYEIIKNATPKLPEAYTLGDNQTRFGPNNEILAEGRKVTKWSNPIAVVDPTTGKQKFIQQDEQGNIRDVSGVTPVVKAGQAGLTVPTKAFTTQNQSQIQAIDNVIPKIKELSISKTIPGQFTGKYFQPSNQATYEAQTASVTDTLIGALGLPKTNESIELVNKMIVEKPYENRANYQKRINKLIDDLQDRRKRAVTALESNVAYGGANQMVTIRNSKTGETKTVTLEEAQRIGAR